MISQPQWIGVLSDTTCLPAWLGDNPSLCLQGQQVLYVSRDIKFITWQKDSSFLVLGGGGGGKFWFFFFFTVFIFFFLYFIFYFYFFLVPKSPLPAGTAAGRGKKKSLNASWRRCIGREIFVSRMRDFFSLKTPSLPNHKNWRADICVMCHM